MPSLKPFWMFFSDMAGGEVEEKLGSQLNWNGSGISWQEMLSCEYAHQFLSLPYLIFDLI